MRLNNVTAVRGLFCLTAFIFFLAASNFVIVAQQQTDPLFAIQRGYRTGYSDGYMAGYRDIIDGSVKNLAKHAEYTKADRAYSRDYGTLDDYRDGYQQGFEAGYSKGFEKQAFESALPTGLKRRGVLNVSESNLATNTVTTQPATVQSPQITTTTQPVTTTPAITTPVAYTTSTPIYDGNGAVILIPRDTELILELQEDLSTERSREGERFTAKIVSPSEIAGAIVEGRVSRITAPGRIKRKSELALSFDRIVISDARWSNFAATLIEVMPVKGDNIKRVDDEGTAIGQSSLKSDAVKVGGATGAGALIGGVVGGPVGVAVGAGVGAAFGVGAVVIERGKHVNLARNQQMRIKTAYETQIR